MRQIAIIAALLFPTIAHAECKATMGAYNAIQDGMSVAQVEQIIGCAGQEISSSSFGGIKTIMLMWEGNSFGGNMNAMFQNDALITKAQFGLK